MASDATSFTIEASGIHGGDIIIQNIGNLRMRGAIRSTKQVFDKQFDPELFEEGKDTRPAANQIIDGVPELPGQRLTVNPAEGTWELTDPLHGNERVMGVVQKALRMRHGVRVSEKLTGVPPQKGSVDKDRMKTLCRELLCFIESEDATVVKGIKPTREDIDEMDGRYLLNASNLGNWHQPRYEDQYDAWVADINRIGG